MPNFIACLKRNRVHHANSARAQKIPGRVVTHRLFQYYFHFYRLTPFRIFNQAHIPIRLTTVLDFNVLYCHSYKVWMKEKNCVLVENK